MTPSAVNANSPITEADIANYLVNSPDFFERHADALAAIALTSPHSQRTISLQERQAEILRAKIRELELTQSQLLRFGQTNVDIAQTLHDWTLALLAAPDASALVKTLVDDLAQAFALSQVQLRLRAAPQQTWPAAVALSEGEPLAAACTALTTVSCGALQPGPWTEALTAPHAVASLAVLPLQLQPGGSDGFLLLASDDPQRFSPDMGTLFLMRIAALASAALRRVAVAQATL